VVVDCAAIVPSLMESELFGHKQGAYTGAAKDRNGLIAAANGGTAFFDEIGELPLDLQPKLLRVLQYREFRVVGSAEIRKIECQVVSATNRDLEKAAQAGTFRRDLLYRLDVGSIRVPPLRERREDIPLLVRHFMERLSAVHTLTGECHDALQQYDWPGNVRELEHCLARLVTVFTGPVLGVETLPARIRDGRRSEVRSPAIPAHEFREPSPHWNLEPPEPVRELPEQPIVTRREAERQAVLAALRRTNGDKGRAAAVLGIGRTTLYRKLAEYARPLPEHSPSAATCQSPGGRVKAVTAPS